MKVQTTNKRPMEFDKVRPGTIFTSDGKTYMKVVFGDDMLAVEMESGAVINPTASDFKECLIYPGAVIKLYGDRKKS